MATETQKLVKQELIKKLEQLVARDVRRLEQYFPLNFDVKPFSISADDFVRQASEFMEVETKQVDLEAFKSWFVQINYPERFADYTKTYPDKKQLEKKAFEHWISLEETKSFDASCVMDVACATSPFYKLVRHELGEQCAQSYRSDLPLPEYGYRAGVHGDTIGCSADDVPLPDESVSRIYAHNAIEHFEGDVFRNFFGEAARLLRPGGSLCVVPLFFAGETYSYVALSGIYRRLSFPKLPSDVKLVYSDAIGQPYALQVSSETLKLFLEPIKTMRFKAIQITNAAQYGVQVVLLGIKAPNLPHSSSTSQ